MKNYMLLFACVGCMRLSAEACNGREDFCDKRYNEIFGQVRIHNAASYFDPRTLRSLMKSSIMYVYPNPVADQSIPFQEQLNDDRIPRLYPRVFKFPLHPVEKNGVRRVWTSHTLSYREFEEKFDHNKYAQALAPWLREKIRTFIKQDVLWRIDATNMPFLDILQQLKEFLDTHKSEVVTLSLNIFDLTLDEFVAVFKESGIYPYIHVQDLNQAWPTLRELIDLNKRLIIFQDEYRIRADSPDTHVAALVKQYPWITGFLWSDDFIFGNRYGFADLEKLENDFCDILNDNYIRDQAAYQNKDRKPENKIFDLSHTVTPGWAADKKITEKANRYDVLVAHIKRCYESLGMLPNTVTLDFYDSDPGCLVAVSDVCNQPGCDESSLRSCVDCAPAIRLPGNFSDTCPAESREKSEL